MCRNYYNWNFYCNNRFCFQINFTNGWLFYGRSGDRSPTKRSQKSFRNEIIISHVSTSREQIISRTQFLGPLCDKKVKWAKLYFGMKNKLIRIYPSTVSVPYCIVAYPTVFQEEPIRSTGQRPVLFWPFSVICLNVPILPFKL